MYYIIGLGNPGKKYEHTRHNVGYIVLDKIKEVFNFSDFETNKKINSDLSKGEIGNSAVVLVKSRSYMNESGKTVQNLLNFYKENPDNIIVIHDDIDLMLGKTKISRDSSSGGHNGVQDIIDKIDSKKFTRIRIGIANEKLRSLIDPADFVLQKLPPEELEMLKTSITDALENILSLLEKKS
jgi:peptidyl-tRNA hydrolase, PTH1 family